MLLQHCDAGTRKGARRQALILVLLDTGLRASELANLELADVDFTAQRMLIKHAKGNKQRVVRFGERTRQRWSTTSERSGATYQASCC